MTAATRHHLHHQSHYDADGIRVHEAYGKPVIRGEHVAMLERIIYGQAYHHAGGWCRCDHCDPAPPAPVAHPHHRCADHVYVPGSDECVLCGKSVLVDET